MTAPRRFTGLPALAPDEQSLPTMRPAMRIEATPVSNVKAPLVLRNSFKGAYVALTVWVLIVGGAYLATSTFVVPLAVILGLILLPVAIAGGYTVAD